jgi:hypothetical protein
MKRIEGRREKMKNRTGFQRNYLIMTWERKLEKVQKELGRGEVYVRG